MKTAGKKKKEIFIGNIGIGGDHPVSLQSMTSTATSDVASTLKQIRDLQAAGCEIVRVAIPDLAMAADFQKIVQEAPLPIIADIHFDHRIAIAAIEAGANGIRINPGNIGSEQKVIEILQCAKHHRVPIRIGVNSGSIEKRFIKAGKSKIDTMVDSLMDKVRFCEKNGFSDLKLSIKSSDVRETVLAYRQVDGICDYPLHLGITESGTRYSGTIKSAIGIGALLLDGIGNTIRVSLTDNPVNEIKPAIEILKATGNRPDSIEFISCPTCARTSVNLIEIARTIEAEIEKLKLKKKLKVAVMGCEVNGPGEAKDADIGIAFSKSHGFIFEKGKLTLKTGAESTVEQFLERLQQMAKK